jgi:hypothetical protein
MRRPKVLHLAVLALGASFGTLLPLTACYSNVADDLTGDPPADAGPPNALGGGARISSVVPFTEPDGAPNPDHPAEDAGVDITGASLIIIDNFDETHDGKSIGAVYVQDVWPTGQPVPPNSGIQLYEPTYSPPNLIIAPGDVIDFTGLYQDYAYSGFMVYPPQASQPEIYKPIVTFRFEYNAPTPTKITASDLANPATYAQFELGHRWLSMLVEVDSDEANGDIVIGESVPDGTGRQALAFTSDTSSVNKPVISNELFDLQPQDYGCPKPPGAGKCSGVKLKKLIGVVTYFFAFHIAPRSAADLVRE